MRVVPVFIMKSAGEWLFDPVQQLWMKHILSTCIAVFGNRSLHHVPLAPCCLNSNGDFIKPPTEPGKKPVFGSKPSSVCPSRFASSGL